MPRVRFRKGCGLPDAFRSIAESMEPLSAKWLRSGEGSLKKVGAEGLAKDILSARTQGEIKAGGLVADYHKNIKGMTKPEFESFMSVIQGTGRAINPRVLAAAKAEIARLEKTEAQLGTREVNIDPITTDRADKAVISDYYSAAARSIEEFNAFGSRVGSVGHQLPKDVATELKVIKDTGGDHRTARIVVDAYFNPSHLTELEQAIWDKIAGYEVATKLGMSVISNSTQSANVALVTSNATMLKSLAKAITQYTTSGDFALRAGSILSSITHESQVSSGVTPHGFASKMMIPHSEVELVNRITASMAGAEHAAKMFKRLKENSNDAYARRHLTHWLGLDPDVLVNQKYLTLEQVYTAAHTLTDRTQFRTTPMEVPPSWGSGLAPKMIFLFKNFAYNQTRFMRDIIQGEVLHGNLRPIIPLLSAMPILGFLADRTKRLISGREVPKGFWPTVFASYGAVGGFGIVSDLAARAAVGQLANSLIGPPASDAVGLFESVYKGTEADPAKGTKRFLTRQIPVAGPRLSRELYPPEKGGSSGEPPYYIDENGNKITLP